MRDQTYEMEFDKTYKYFEDDWKHLEWIIGYHWKNLNLIFVYCDS